MYRVFVDANVLYSRTLRDWLGLLYTLPDEPPFVVFWSEDVLAEVIHHLRRRHPEWAGSRIARIRDLIAGTFEIGRVTDFSVDGDYSGSDPGDAHVHAAAVACRADILLTCNVTDFAAPDKDDSNYEVMHPDEFLVMIDDEDPSLVHRAVLQDLDYWVAKVGEANPPQRLRSAGAKEFAERVRRHLTGIPHTPG